MSSPDHMPLAWLPHLTRARIVRVGADADGRTDPLLEELLLGLGFEEGAPVEIRHQGAFGGPLAVRVDDRMVAIRPTDALSVLVVPDAPETEEPVRAA